MVSALPFIVGLDPSKLESKLYVPGGGVCTTKKKIKLLCGKTDKRLYHKTEGKGL